MNHGTPNRILISGCRSTEPPWRDESLNLLDQISENLSRGANFSDDSNPPMAAVPTVRLIAYYLPQFHPIPENDEWWGKGFTEWTNVTKAIPRYSGHYQPRLPGELGFYDLRIPDILYRQAELARKYGLHGFCFHHYWFNSKPLLQGPLNLLLSRPDIDINFCINWANENWSRRWDGREKEILLRQEYSPEDDINFARSLEPLLGDSRYIRINNRPLILLYRPALLPDVKATIERWREHFVREGFGNPYLVMPQVFEQEDPMSYDMDAASGFPPHRFGINSSVMTSTPPALDPAFQGRVFSYERMARSAMAFQPATYKLFHGVCPDWDNEARSPQNGSSFIGANPRVYGSWLASACQKVMLNQAPDERIVFVNAWNEWAEGAYLEPDRHRGYAYLRETARVLADPGLMRPSAVGSFSPGAHIREQLPPQITLHQLVRKLRSKTATTFGRLANAIRPV
jgi:hypothetical protein